jgi:hypothetical protein
MRKSQQIQSDLIQAHHLKKASGNQFIICERGDFQMKSIDNGRRESTQLDRTIPGSCG